ncbi:hypothetical protein PUN28_000630 [Cardiocondyla obscurior]|uniref:Uncharacterized protein n=1 Tax=Cardiocondyla obscurior TaxID=286306 RepID=A0AAW2H0R6_9HYME
MVESGRAGSANRDRRTCLPARPSFPVPSLAVELEASVEGRRKIYTFLADEDATPGENYLPPFKLSIRRAPNITSPSFQSTSIVRYIETAR